MKLVLLPGMDGTGRLFRHFVEELDELGVQSIVISYPPDCLWGYEEIEAYVRASLPHNEAYVVLAESFSGPVGLRLASNPPSGMQALILCCTFAKISSAFLRSVAPLGRFVSARWIPQFVIRGLVYGRYVSSTLLQELEMALAAIPDKTLKFRVREVLKADVTNVLERIHMPVLYLKANEDRLIGPEHCEWLRTHVESMQVRSFPGPHLLLQACPYAAAKETNLFLISVLFRAKID